MSLFLNPDKVRQAMESTETYMITIGTELSPQPPSPESVQVYGTSAAIPADLERSRERLLSLRRSLIDSGVRPLSGAELDREINEIRGRS